jgi:uncharacterized integral membrane protein
MSGYWYMFIGWMAVFTIILVFALSTLSKSNSKYYFYTMIPLAVIVVGSIIGGIIESDKEFVREEQERLKKRQEQQEQQTLI